MDKNIQLILFFKSQEILNPQHFQILCYAEWSRRISTHLSILPKQTVWASDRFVVDGQLLNFRMQNILL